MIAVLGLGSIGLRHSKNLIELGQQVCGYDPSPERRELLLASGGQIATTHDAALANASAVIICSPNQLHLADLRAAIARKLHVFIEKPISHTDADVEKLLDQAATAGLTVFCGFNLRYHPSVVAVRDWIGQGRLGTPLWARFTVATYLPEWRPQQDYRKGYTADPVSGGVLFDCSHEIDLANHLLGRGDVKAAVVRRSGILDMASEDCAELVLEHASGAHSSIHLDYITRPRIRNSVIVGTKGSIMLDLDKRHATLLGPAGDFLAEDQSAGDYASDYKFEMQSFLACIQGEDKPRCDGYDALSVVRQILSARKMSGLPLPE